MLFINPDYIVDYSSHNKERERAFGRLVLNGFNPNRYGLYAIILINFQILLKRNN